jgi:hypothetical protein
MTEAPIRRFSAKPDKKFVDVQAAIPSSRKMPRMASCRAAEWASIGLGLCAPRVG